MPQYFSKYPKINYKFRYTDSKNNVVNTDAELTNISIRYSLSDQAKKTTEVFYPYSWNDTDRPDSFSEKYYDSNDLFWLVMYGADKYDVFNEFPKSENVFFQYMYIKYKDAAVAAGRVDSLSEVIAWTKQQIHSYEDGSGDVIDRETYLILSDSNRRIVSLFDFEERENDKLRSIDVISLDFASQARRDFEDALNQLKKELEE